MQLITLAVDVKQRAHHIYDFELHLRRHNYNAIRPYTSVWASGSIVLDKGLDATVIRGEVRVRGEFVIWLFVVVPLVLGITWLVLGPFVLIPAAITLVRLFEVRRIVRDYRRLVDLIYEAVR